MPYLTSCHLAGPHFLRANVARTHAEWAKALERDDAGLGRMYQAHLANLRGLLGVPARGRLKQLWSRIFGGYESPAYSDELHYRFAVSFASDKFLIGANPRAEASVQLALIHEEHLELIGMLLDRPDRVLTQQPLPQAKGTLGEVAEAALLIYFHHMGYGFDGMQMRVDVARLVPKLLRRFPYLNSNLLVHLLQRHPDFVEATAGLIHDIFLQPGREAGSGPYGWIGQDMCGRHTPRDDPYRKYGAEIMTRALADAADWPEAALADLVQVFALGPLGLTLRSQEEEVRAARASVAQEEAMMAKGFDAPVGGMSAAKAEGQCRKRLKAARGHLALMETDYDRIRQKNFGDAAKLLARADGVFKTVTVIANALPKGLAAPLSEALDAGAALKNGPPAFAMPKPSENRFKDFGFKVMVIEELMYEQKRLLPAFDLRRFAEEWTAREISVENDGYEIIPEVRSYFENLAIPGALLAHVEVLTQKSGIYGCGGVMEQMVPFWDPGVGDGPVPVTDRAVEDLDLVPNLKCVVGLENEANAPRPERFLKELEKRGIRMEEEEGFDALV